MREIARDLGGSQSLSAGQSLLLDMIRSKLIVLLQLSKYIGKQTSIIDDHGKPLECLRSLHLGYSDSLRRDLEALFGFDRRKQKVSRYKAALEALGGAGS